MEATFCWHSPLSRQLPRSPCDAPGEPAICQLWSNSLPSGCQSARQRCFERDQPEHHEGDFVAGSGACVCMFHALHRPGARCTGSQVDHNSLSMRLCTRSTRSCRLPATTTLTIRCVCVAVGLPQPRCPPPPWQVAESHGQESVAVSRV
jgi:hypothetical protein